MKRTAGAAHQAPQLWATVLAVFLGISGSAAAGIVEFHSNLETWEEFAPAWSAYAFEQDFPPQGGSNGCRSGAGTVTADLTGGTVAITRADGECPIRDGSSSQLVSDLHLEQGVSAMMVFDPPVRALYGFYSSVAVGAKMELHLQNGERVDHMVDTPVSTDSVDARGHGFVSSVPVERITLTTTEVGTSVFGAFVDLGGETSFEALGAACGPGGTRGLFFTCDFGYSYSAQLAAGTLVYPEDPSTFDGFGRTVGRTESSIVVGAPWRGPNGEVVVFERDLGGSGLWGPTEILAAPPDRGGNLNFGTQVAIDGHRLAVSGGSDPARSEIWIYERCAEAGCPWQPVTSFGDDLLYSGEQLQLSGDHLAFRAYIPGSGGDPVVALYGRTATGEWQEIEQISPPPLCFGQPQLDLEEDVLVVGCGSQASVYRFDGDVQAWNLEQQVELPGPVTSLRAVAVKGKLLAIAYQGDPGRGNTRGLISLYAATGSTTAAAWQLLQTVDEFDLGIPSSALGQTLGLWERVFVAGNAQGDLVVFRPDVNGVWEPAQQLRQNPLTVGAIVEVDLFDERLVFGTRFNDSVGSVDGVAFELDLPLFLDGFESGDTDLWE